MSHQEEQRGNEPSNTKAVSGVQLYQWAGVMIPFFIAMWTYMSQAQSAKELRERELLKPFREKQFATYLKLNEAITDLLVNARNEERLPSLLTKFEKAAVPCMLISSTQVLEQLQNIRILFRPKSFGSGLFSVREDGPNTAFNLSLPVPVYRLTDDEIASARQAYGKFGSLCREDIALSWRVNLPKELGNGLPDYTRD